MTEWKKYFENFSPAQSLQLNLYTQRTLVRSNLPELFRTLVCECRRWRTVRKVCDAQVPKTMRLVSTIPNLLLIN